MQPVSVDVVFYDHIQPVRGDQDGEVYEDKLIVFILKYGKVIHHQIVVMNKSLEVITPIIAMISFIP